ncbi:hypothetical protein D3C73_1281390 [compost metagenome]
MQIHFAGRDDPSDAHLLKRSNHFHVMYIHHDRGMHRDRQVQLLDQSKYGKILDDNRIRSRLLKKPQIVFRLFDFAFI